MLAIAMLLNALSAQPPPLPGSADADSFSARDEALLFDAATTALLRMPQARFDTQSVATTLNALAARGRFDAPLFRHLAAAVLAPRDGFSLQSAAMVLNSYARMLDAPGGGPKP
ncbi:hypothetical protein T484DRAFT_1782514 [Baffinella frigidus]|nr:hypothetical protein T484DRAFT_1782514 [Cryptophyta sp. CCMP2293]